MKISTQAPLKVLLLSFALILHFSCSKDTDLLTDYVLSETQNTLALGQFVIDDTFVISSKGSITLDVLANDAFESTDEVMITETSTPSNGTVEINNDNTLTYTLDDNENIADEIVDNFTYTTEVVSEDQSVTTTEEGAVTVVISPLADRNLNYGELKAFPTAYGAGAYATGGRGGSVYHVTNLNNSGTGSFRDAVSKSNRVIVFDVSGTINLTSRLNINADNLTIAGQTAPVGGIAITGESVYISSANNIIIRYVRFRPVYRPGGSASAVGDALNVNNCDNSIFDHISVSWGGDEALSITGDSDDFTVSSSILAESKTAMLAGDSNNDISSNISIHGNIFYNISHRFPNVNASRVDVINNIVHNWFTRLLVASSYDGAQLNQINNYYQRGSRPTTVLSSGNPQANWLDIGTSSQKENIRIFVSGNVINDVLAATDDQWNGFYRHRFDITSGAYTGIKQWDNAHSDFKASGAFTLLGDVFPYVTAAEVITDVPQEAGANRTLDGSGNIIKEWDAVDEHYLGYVTTNTFQSYSYSSDMEDGGIRDRPHYVDYQNAVSSTPKSTRDENYDTDGDGMPDAWEILKGFDPNKMDHNDDIDGNGYTNLEEFLNLVDF